MSWTFLLVGYFAILVCYSDSSSSELILEEPYKPLTVSAERQLYTRALKEANLNSLPGDKRGLSALSRWKPLTSAFSSLRPLDLKNLRSLHGRYMSRVAQEPLPPPRPLRYGRR